MENHNPSTPEEGIVVCPNCGSSHMEEIQNPFTTMDHLEWHSFATTALLSGILIFSLGQYAVNYFAATRNAPEVFGYTLVGLLVLLAIACSYFRIADLSIERYRRDGICVWYTRCAKCHSRFRVVRPFGTIPPWEIENDVVEAEYEEIIEEDLHATDS